MFLPPINQALQVNNVTLPPASITPLRREKQKHHIDKEVHMSRTYRKLVRCFDLLPDPVANIIYPKKESDNKCKARKKGKRGKKRGSVIQITPRRTIEAPTCCEFHQNEVREVVAQHRKYLYNTPQPILIPSNRFVSRFEKIVTKNRLSNSNNQFPLPTISVRWHDSANYTIEVVEKIMSIFGNLKSVHQQSTNSAYVVFENLVDACRLVRKKCVGDLDIRLFCNWVHPCMNSKRFYGVGRTFRVVNDELIFQTKLTD